MIKEEQLDEYTNKLKRYLANPSSTQTFYESYQEDHSEADFEEYTQAIEDLITRLEEKKVKDQDSLCKEIQKLKLPHNQFGC